MPPPRDPHRPGRGRSAGTSFPSTRSPVAPSPRSRRRTSVPSPSISAALSVTRTPGEPLSAVRLKSVPSETKLPVRRCDAAVAAVQRDHDPRVSRWHDVQRTIQRPAVERLRAAGRVGIVVKRQFRLQNFKPGQIVQRGQQLDEFHPPGQTDGTDPPCRTTAPRKKAARPTNGSRRARAPFRWKPPRPATGVHGAPGPPVRCTPKRAARDRRNTVSLPPATSQGQRRPRWWACRGARRSTRASSGRGRRWRVPPAGALPPDGGPGQEAKHAVGPPTTLAAPSRNRSVWYSSSLGVFIGKRRKSGGRSRERVLEVSARAGARVVMMPSRSVA